MEQKALRGLVIGYSLTLPSLRPGLWPHPAPGRFPVGLSLLRLFHFPYIVLFNETLSRISHPIYLHLSIHILRTINPHLLQKIFLLDYPLRKGRKGRPSFWPSFALCMFIPRPHLCHCSSPLSQLSPLTVTLLSLIPQIFIEHLLCFKSCSRCCVYSAEKTRYGFLPSWSLEYEREKY